MEYGVWKHSVTVTLQMTKRQDKCIWIHCIFLWGTYCMEEQKYEKCGFVNHQSRICSSVRTGERNQVFVSTMGIMVSLPIKIKVDNVGAIWLENNSGVSERTKHIEIRVHFVRLFVMDK